jgi:uncharacterized coiled-coil protein SlyX
MGARDEQEELVELQSRLAYQERTLEALDAAVGQQEPRIERLQAAVDHLSRRFDAILGEGPRREAPPRD